jgi:hypothetical protein
MDYYEKVFKEVELDTNKNIRITIVNLGTDQQFTFGDLESRRGKHLFKVTGVRGYEKLTGDYDSTSEIRDLIKKQEFEKYIIRDAEKLYWRCHYCHKHTGIVNEQSVYNLPYENLCKLCLRQIDNMWSGIVLITENGSILLDQEYSTIGNLIGKWEFSK